MKQQLSLGIVAVLLTSTVLAVGPRPVEVKVQTAAERDRARNEGRGVRPMTSAAGETKADTKRLDRISETARFADMSGRTVNVLESFESRKADIVNNERTGADDSSITKKTTEITGESILKEVEVARKMSTTPEVDGLRIDGAKLIVRLAVMMEPRFIQSSEFNNMNSQAMKFLHDYAKTLSDPRSTVADVESYNVLGTKLLEYASTHINENVAQIYEKGIPEDARKRQEDCLNG